MTVSMNHREPEQDRLGASHGFRDAALYSAYVITLQKSEPRPLTKLY
jgi:hypothetical protein